MTLSNQAIEETTQRMHSLLEAIQQGSVANGGFQDGRIVDLRRWNGEVVLVGDLHAKGSRLTAILEHAQLLPKLAAKESVLVLLGDLIHRECAERAGEMDSSLEILFQIAKLKCDYPTQVYILLGNHEFTQTLRSKQGVPQGAVFRAIMQKRYPDMYPAYQEFLAQGALLAVHTHFAASHAAPPLDVPNLEALRQLPVADIQIEEFHPWVHQLTHYRHIDHDLTGRRAYRDCDVATFLELCGVVSGPMVHGHSPVDRETGWEWEFGPRNRIIFAAGREVGYAKADPQGLRWVRAGRSLLEDDDRLIWDRTPPLEQLQNQATVHDCLHWDEGRSKFEVDHRKDVQGGIALLPDVGYRLRGMDKILRIHIGLDGEEIELNLKQYRQLPGWLRSANQPGSGWFLVGNESKRELLGLKRDNTILVGDERSEQRITLGIPALSNQEVLLITQRDSGEFLLRPLCHGVRLSW